MDQDPEKIGWIVGSLVAGAASLAAVVKGTRSRFFTGTKVDDLSKQLDGRFTEVCKRLDKLDAKYEDTQLMVRTVLTDQADKFGRIETRLEDHGRRLNNLERQ